MSRSTRTRISTGLGLLLTVASLSSACTARYSQSLVGTIPKPTGQPVNSTATGFSFLQIVLSEPTPAHEQVSNLMANCRELTGVEIDYRELVIIIVSIPRVSVTGTCVS